ncbi:bestrophin-like domain [Glycomyces lechevalierae]|uniref:DUF4239 domain-containing protein n=3 Tax=Glycomycetaceae TaxID=85034 RepID=A0A9X3SUR5_9ACTN|nr:DUF4239 domain-containing protein [Glycomyces lechevalierae]MDA1385830.1 DUF4239 domain-containing protein [Glycomyces lechevalierae]
MPIWLQGLLFTLSIVALACVVVALLQKFAPPTDRAHNNELGTTIFELLTVLYAIVLAFVLITAWENKNEAGQVTYREANELVDVYWSAAALAPEQRDQVRDSVRAYTNEVIDAEWPAMRDQEPVTAEGLMLLDEMRAPVAGARTDDDVVQSRLDATEDGVLAVSEYRTERLFAAQSGLSAAMWTVLVPGAILVFAVMLTLGTPTRKYQFVLVGLVSGMVALMLFATYQLEYPFSRSGATDPVAYEIAIERFDAIDANYDQEQLF